MFFIGRLPFIKIKRAAYSAAGGGAFSFATFLCRGIKGAVMAFGKSRR